MQGKAGQGKARQGRVKRRIGQRSEEEDKRKWESKLGGEGWKMDECSVSRPSVCVCVCVCV